MPLSPEAKQELNEAIRIVREDRFEKFVRSRQPKPPEPPQGDPLLDPDPKLTDPKPTDPKPTDPPKKEDPPTPPKEPVRSRYWGELGID